MAVNSTMLTVLTIVASLLATPAVSQQSQITMTPTFVPLTINQSDYQAIQNWLGEQPAKFSIPVLTWLDGLERKAQEDAKKAAPAPDGAKK